MRLISLFLCFSTCFVFAEQSYAQSAKLSLHMDDVTVSEALEAIEKNATFHFFYNNTLIDMDRKVSVKVDNKDVFTILDIIFKDSDVRYKVVDHDIILTVANPFLQNGIPISGTVTDENGEPLPGVNVVVKGTTIGVVSGFDGKYNINVPDHTSTLIFSFMGYTTQEIAIGDQRIIPVTLVEDTREIEEVVVVGYGTQKKVNLTGSVASISSEALNKRQVGQTSLALQGLAPGVTITQRSGQPGLGTGDIKIRGIGTLNNSSPLILVDGLEMEINNLDVSVIESISVLKDAASSSIYGSKAANGVILITTKRAAEGKFSLSYNGYVGWQSATNLPKKVNALEHIRMLNESKINAGAGVVYTDEQIKAWETLGPTDRDHYPDTDWQKEVLKGNGLQHNHSLTMTGGTDRLKVLASIGYLGQNGIIDNVDFKRISVRLNTDFVFSKNFSSSLDIYLYNANRNSVSNYQSNSSNGSGIGYIFFSMNKLPAVQAARYSNGNYAEGQNGENPVASIYEGGYTKEESTPITASLSFKWEPIDNLRLQTTFSPSISYPMWESFIRQVTTYNPDGSVFSTLPSKSNLTKQSTYSRYLQSRTTVDYKKTLKGHTISALAGFQYESNYNSGFNGYRDDFPFPEYTLLQSGSVENMKNDGWADENALLSWFGRINYDYKSKYLLEANIRYDGSSKFAKGNKWGAFPSFSAGWRLSEEFFWGSLKNIVPNFKVRGSWGTLGNQNIGSNYPFSSNITMDTKYISKDNLVDGAAVITMNNPDITWETTTMTNIGVDLGLFNKVNVAFDWFYKETKDILMTLDIPQTMGLNPTYQNAGVVENKGYELNITYADRIGDFDFDVSFNFSDVKNKITDLKGINGTGLVTNREGYAINSLYMRKSLGILSNNDFESDGKYKWVRQ